jgi:hypothetical protein
LDKKIKNKKSGAQLEQHSLFGLYILYGISQTTTFYQQATPTTACRS